LAFPDSFASAEKDSVQLEPIDAELKNIPQVMLLSFGNAETLLTATSKDTGTGNRKSTFAEHSAAILKNSVAVRSQTAIHQMEINVGENFSFVPKLEQPTESPRPNTEPLEEEEQEEEEEEKKEQNEEVPELKDDVSDRTVESEEAPEDTSTMKQFAIAHSKPLDLRSSFDLELGSVPKSLPKIPGHNLYENSFCSSSAAEDRVLTDLLQLSNSRK
jgi:hypothetical protein